MEQPRLRHDHVILGAGPAGVIAAETIRKHAPLDAITLVGDEREPPYSRMAIPYLLIGNIVAFTVGPTGVAGFSGTPPLLGSEPKPVPERPYDMANDQALFQFEGNRMSADCCPSPFSGDRGCVCLTDKQLADFASRGGNRSSKD